MVGAYPLGKSCRVSVLLIAHLAFLRCGVLVGNGPTAVVQSPHAMGRKPAMWDLWIRRPFACSARTSSVSPEKLFDRVLCARILCWKTNGDSDPVIEARERPRDLDTFINEMRRDYAVRLSRFEENEISL